MTLLWRFKSVSNRVLKTTDPCNTHALNVPISYRMEPWFSSRKKNPGGWQERNVICVQVKTLSTMVKMISIVRTVILCLAVCDVCWTRYLALDDDTEDSYLPETEVSLFTVCLFFVMYHYDDNISVCYELVNLLSPVVFLIVQPCFGIYEEHIYTTSKDHFKIIFLQFLSYLYQELWYR